MRASDFIVEFLINKGITDVFGYPGGMVTPLMDSFSRYSEAISAHVNYHEQSASFAACGYAQTSGKPGVAYATSGPGATNLITGVGNAYFDSIPAIFLTGQVNSNECKGTLGVRQRGFQETDIVSICKPLCKYAVYVHSADILQAELEKAYYMAMKGRRGPVLLDIPMDVLKSEVHICMSSLVDDEKHITTGHNLTSKIAHCLRTSTSPVIIIGAGIKSICLEDRTRSVLRKLNIPVVSSMIAFDIMKDEPNYYGFIGAYGSRTANFIVAKSDLVIAIGTRLDIRQVGANREDFAPNARIIRFDIDEGELEYRVHEDEEQYVANISEVLDILEKLDDQDYHLPWISICDTIRERLLFVDDSTIGNMINGISEKIPDEAVITTDVGQNQVWISQSFKVKTKQKVLFSGGHGAMGYSLPAAIGAYYGSGGKPVYCITGDGGIQMNIQEIQFIVREKIPVKIIVLNNNALGMIRHFQEMYYNGCYYQTKPEGGYSAPNFEHIAKAYGLQSRRVELSDIDSIKWLDGAELVEVMIRQDTYVSPKLEFGKPNQDQEPLLERELYDIIMNMHV